MSAIFNKTGVINTNDFYEAFAMSDLQRGSSALSYTPTTGTNSCLNNMYIWFYPSDAVAGDTFRVFATVSYSGFDTSNTSGTFRMNWQGANFTNATTAVWQGSNPICPTLNSKMSLTTLVLSSASGIYTYETTFVLQQTFIDTYIGSYIGIRSDYSNGIGTISIKDVYIIPEKYSITNTAPLVKVRMGNDYIVTNEFIEY